MKTYKRIIFKNLNKFLFKFGKKHPSKIVKYRVKLDTRYGIFSKRLFANDIAKDLTRNRNCNTVSMMAVLIVIVVICFR